MKKRLTISINPTIIENATIYANENGLSLSLIIENYLTELVKSENKKEVSKKLKAIVGAVSLPSNFNEEAELHSYFKNKHLK